MMYYFSNLKYIDGNEINFLSFIVFGTLLIKHDSINQLSSEMFRQLISHMQFKLQQTLDDSNLGHKKLIEKIGDRYQSKSLLPDKPKNWVLNVSKSNLKESETQVLELDLKFCLSTKNNSESSNFVWLGERDWQLPPHEADLMKSPRYLKVINSAAYVKPRRERSCLQPKKARRHRHSKG